MIQFSTEQCRDLQFALSREWLETNGLGGFSSSTIIGLNTRRYHGLLTASLNPPADRYVLLSKLEETITIDGQQFDLSTNQYVGSIYPQGYQYLKAFRLDPFPVFTYEVNGTEIKKSIFMICGENSTVIQYQVRPADGASKIELHVRPLIAFRDYHCTTHENNTLNPTIQSEDQWAAITPYEGLPTLYFSHDATSVDPTGYWYKNFEYDQELQRGLDFNEDLYSPFVLKFDLNTRYSVNLIASTKRHDIAQVNGYQKAEIKRRREILASSPSDKYFVRQLTAAADQFVVKRKDQKTVIAGYHWFGDWGRDTMIALPGLTLVTGRYDVAKSILLGLARSVDCGMIPNRSSDHGEQAEYNTVDATLWFILAIRSFLKYTGDYKTVRDNFYPVLVDIISWHVRGTRYGIRVDSDGLLSAGQSGVQLTWMDAKVGDWVVTPRYGKPVEVQALWYNVLCFMEELADIFGDKLNHTQYARMEKLAHKSFNDLFWNQQTECLYDCVNGNDRDGSIRPNQVFAVSLPHSLLSQDRAKKVIEVIERDLLTPYGLRSLSPTHPYYRGRYEGDPWSRDSAYHQGTVWAWLLGPFITAYLKVHDRNDATVEKVTQWCRTLSDHLNDAGLGQISEIFDGDAPYTARGAIAQGWSVAELLRVICENIIEVKVNKTQLIKNI